MSWYNFFPKQTAIITISGGVRFDIINPDYKLIKLYDVALSLSNLCRFNGHVESFYSVAEHCINVAEAVKAMGHPEEVVRAALMHDAAEAFCSDVTTPFKAYLGKRYKRIEHKLEVAIGKQFGIDFDRCHDIVKFFDKDLYKVENNHLKHGIKDFRIKCLQPKSAKIAFLDYAESCGVTVSM